MKFKYPVLVVDNLERSIAFYEEIVGDSVAMDFSDLVVFEGGFALTAHTEDNEDVVAPHVLRFEEDDYDGLLSFLADCQELEYKQQCQTLDTGQRYLSFYDPDNNIVEVIEAIEAVIPRLLQLGLSVEAVSEKTRYPIEFVRRFV